MLTLSILWVVLAATVPMIATVRKVASFFRTRAYKPANLAGR